MADEGDSVNDKAASDRARHAQSKALISFSEFDSNLEAVRDLAVNARTHTKPLDDSKAYFLRLVRRWNKHESDEDILIVLSETARLTTEALTSIKERIEGGEDFDASAAMHDAIRSCRQQAIETHCSDASFQLRYRLDIQHAMDRRSRSTVLHSSLLISAVASIEVLIGDIVRAYLIAFPDTMTSSEKTMSTEALAEFKTMEEFWSHHRESRVDKLMRQDIGDWLDWCERYLKLKPDQISPSHKDLTEIFLTRNVHVHNAGKVNNIYLRSCQQHGITPRAGVPDNELPITPEYLVQSIDILHVTGMLVVYGLLKKVGPRTGREEEFDISWLKWNIYPLLETDRHTAVLSLAQLLPNSDDERDDIVQVNIWVARKEIEGLDAIRDEVEAWSTEEKEPQFQLVRLALLEDYPAAQTIAEAIYGTDLLSKANWNSWPVLRGLRDWISDDPDRGRFLLT